MDLHKISEILNKYRLELNLSSAEAAKMLQVSAPYYSRLENGKEKPSRELVQKIAAAFELSLSDTLDLNRAAGVGGVDSVPASSSFPPDTAQEANISIDFQKTPVLFSDSMFISITDNGVVFDFGQKVGPTNQTAIMSRVGVSRTHAQKIYDLLGQQLKKAKELRDESSTDG